jgi:hypothetical protein
LLGSVFIKKSNQTEFKKKKPKPGQTDRFRFGSVRFFRAKTGSNRFGSVFPVLARFFPVWLVFLVWLGFSGLARVFFLVFCRFLFGSVRFFVYKTETEPASFFKNLIGFFFRFGFFDYFFSGFLSLIDFPVFFSPLT